MPALALALLAGCGGGGVSAGSTVNVYVSQPLCPGAERALAAAGGAAAEVRLRAVCLPSAERGSGLDLATLGADARRAGEDSTAIAYLQTTDNRAAEFTRPILESADIVQLEAASGAAAMRRVLAAVEAADSSSLRSAVSDALRR